MSRGLGDLRNLSRKPWSKSADDLSKLSSHMPAPILTPIDTTIHDKIELYRNNRGGSMGSMNNSSPSVASTVSAQQKNLPFPTICTSPSDPLSSSPPGRPSIQLSAASPTLTDGAALGPSLSNSSTHVHTRSHSFTPRLPSKLASPKGVLQPPVSPKRKGSGGSVTERTPDREREKNLTGGSGGHGPSARSPFPFSLGGGRSPVNPSSPTETPSSPTSLFPPKIVEPSTEASGSKTDKRLSQIVLHSGFINRLVDFSPTALNVRATHAYMSGSSAPTLSKGWKPYKLVLKGSKLYFYKPPSDRNAAVKDLFPTELVAVLEDEGLTDGEFDAGDGDEDTSRGSRMRDRKRAYWGRATHPSLVVVDGKIERGAFEALVHEAVFATTFVKGSASSGEDDQMRSDAEGASPADEEGTSQPSDAPAGSSRYVAAWRDFAASVLFSLPFAVGRDKFETEFLRCCSYLVSGAEDAVKGEETERVRWLAGQYLGYHGAPVDRDAWEQWRKDNIPDFPADFSAAAKPAGLPQSTSMQALYSASPQLGSSTPGQLEASPDLGAFSPRPDADSKMMSIVDALGVLPPSNPTSTLAGPSSSSRTSRDAMLAALARDGFTRDALVGLDSQLLAHSLFVFNRSLLQNVPDNFTADLCLSSDTTEAESASGATSSVLAPFLGSDDQPHWLTRMILIQILVPESSSGTMSSPPIGYPLIASEERHVPTSRTHTRSEVISAWAKIGELCRRTGDECSWRAIFAALCSRPVARLEKVWKRVDAEAVAIVQAWVQPQERRENVSNAPPVIIPWAGDVKDQIHSALERARFGAGDEWQLAPLGEARRLFEALRVAFALHTGRGQHAEPVESSEVDTLVALWRGASEGKNGHGIASKFTR